ncbi:MAG: CoA ester lyase [Opitutaceae bacterium]|nr:CoA ester lyase [Opitutaceae bacterium]
MANSDFRLGALLFTPGSKLDRLPKAVASGADGVIVDLEDSVGPAEKDKVRRDVVAYFKEHGRVQAERPFASVIRCNNLRDAAGRADLDALNAALLRPDFVMLSKVESAAEIQLAARKLPESVRLIGLIETVLGVRFVNEIAAASPRVAALAFGGLDLSAETGGIPHWDALLWPRTMLVHACSAAGVQPLDQPFVDFLDPSGLEHECQRTRALGFVGKLAIHPRQVEIIRRAYEPLPHELERARRVVAAYEAAAGNVASLDGQMIDLPVYKSARRTLQRASRS